LRGFGPWRAANSGAGKYPSFRRYAAAASPLVLRQSGEAFKKSGQLETAARCYAQIGEREEALALLEGCASRRCSGTR